MSGVLTCRNSGLEMLQGPHVVPRLELAHSFFILSLGHPQTTPPSPLQVFLVIHTAFQFFGASFLCILFENIHVYLGGTSTIPMPVCWLPQHQFAGWQFLTFLTVPSLSHSPGCNLLARPWCSFIHSLVGHMHALADLKHNRGQQILLLRRRSGV